MKDFQINFGVRVKNKMFWIAFVPAVIFLIQSVCELFGVSIDLSGKGGQVITIIEALFAVLALMGVVNDPTTEGLSDSFDAMEYNEPKERE